MIKKERKRKKYTCDNINNYQNKTARSSRPEVFCKKGVLRNFAKFTGKHLCQSLFLIEACNFIKKETLAQAFVCEFCEFSKDTFFYRTPPVAASQQLLLSVPRNSVSKTSWNCCFYKKQQVWSIWFKTKIKQMV